MAASGGPNAAMNTVPTHAGEERAERRHAERRPRAALLAIWWPSMQVTIDPASPGMFTRIDVVEPPYCAP